VTLIGVGLFALALAVIQAVHYFSEKQMRQAVTEHFDQLRAYDHDRQDTIYRQNKAAVAEIARVRIQTEHLAERTHAVQEETRLLHARVNGFFDDRRVQRFLDEGVSGREGVTNG
jgi:ABC-type lipoprotein release transport system permease subunit